MRCPSLADLPLPPPGNTGWPWTEESPRLPDTTTDGRNWPLISIVTPSFMQGRFIGARLVERHITLDRAMWGSDQAASVEPGGFTRLVRDIRVTEQALGDGMKRVYESEKPLMERLQRS